MTQDPTTSTTRPRVLVQVFHPAPGKSRLNTRLRAALDDLPGVTVRDLYALYPDFDVDVEAEQQLLATHEAVVFQHPFYWYSVPALLKQWLDLVLEFGWAYGPDGDALRGRTVLFAVTTGGPADAYRPEGHNRFTMQDLMRPLEQTFRLCGMRWEDPFLVHGSRRVTEEQLTTVHGPAYRARVAALRDAVTSAAQLDGGGA